MTKCYNPRLTFRGGAAITVLAALAAAGMLAVVSGPPQPTAVHAARTVPAQQTVVVAQPASEASGSATDAAGESGAVLAEQATRNPLVVVDHSIPVPLATSLIVLPLLMLIWLWSLVRLASVVRRVHCGREHAALAAELGIDPSHLAALAEVELVKLEDKVAFDEMTGVMRRAAGLASLEREVARAVRRQEPLTVAFIDVDGLKKVNDSRGHAAGDRLLKEVVQVLGNRLRGEDEIFRYGGDEFCCILPGATEGDALKIIDQTLVMARARGQAFSVGIAELVPGESSVDLLGRADFALYQGRAARGQTPRSGGTGTISVAPPAARQPSKPPSRWATLA